MPTRRAFRPRMLALLALLAVLAAAHSSAAADVQARATVDRNQVAVGEPIELSIEVNGVQNAQAPALDNLEGFQAQYLGPATQVSFVNGQMTASVTHRYRLFPQQAGRFTIAPFAIEVDGQRYLTEPISIHVSAPSQARPKSAPAPGKADLQLVLSLAKDELYVGERVPLEVVLYVGNTRVDDLQFPAVAGDGVVIDKLGQPSRREEILGGRRYQGLHFLTKLSAVQPGAVQLSATMGMNMLVSRRRGGDQFFDQFFSGAFAERKPVEVRADPHSLTVLPLPEEGRPADFTGAVGRFDFDVTAEPNDLAAGDPVTVRMTIAGEGDLSRVEAPSLAVDERFRKYDAQLAKAEEGGARKVFEQVLIPKEGGAIEIPTVRFSFFDPEKRAYATISRGPFALTVRAPVAPEEPKIVAQAAAPRAGAAPEVLGRDIVYIKSMPGTLRPRGRAFYRHGWFLALQLMPPLGFAGLLAFVRRRERFAADPRLARFRHAGRDARRMLAEIEQAGTGDGFYDRVTGAFHGYLVAKLGLPPGAVERVRVLEQLGGAGASADLCRSVGDLFDLLEQMRYAPSAARGEQHDAALRLARDVVEKLERQRGAATWGVGAMVVALACFGAGAVAEQAVGDRAVDPHAAFFQGNAAYQEGRYADAANAYEQVLGAGVESGELYFNLGNACFKLGRIGEAILGYERARMALPRDPDVRANLSYARESAGDEVEPAPLWTRIAFPLGERATSGELAVVTSVLWLLLWASAAAASALPRLRVPANRATWIFLALMVVVGASFGRRLQQLELTPRSVVVAAGETPVRFEPSATGTEHFRVREGALLEVTDTRDGWCQVRRPDGRRGWISAESLRFVGAPASSGSPVRAQ